MTSHNYPLKYSSEGLHNATVRGLSILQSLPFGCSLIRRLCKANTLPAQTVKVGRLTFDSPIMVAGGWDRLGIALHALEAMGFSSVEVGAVTEFPQPGNPKPRQTMVTPGVVLNHIGFAGPGMHRVKKNLKRQGKCNIPIGLNIGKNKDMPLTETPASYARIAAHLRRHVDYYTLNISSPNTPNLRDLQGSDILVDIIQAVSAVSEKPIWVKVSPDLSLEQIDALVEQACDQGVEALVVGNSSNSEALKTEYGLGSRPGGISGNSATYRDLSTRLIKHIKDSQAPLHLIGSGGITSPEAALEKLDAGADMVQIMTGLRIYGPRLPAECRRCIQLNSSDKQKDID